MIFNMLYDANLVMGKCRKRASDVRKRARSAYNKKLTKYLKTKEANYEEGIRK